MADIKAYIQSHLIEPLRMYPTVIQDTMIEIITDKLAELYDYTVEFPEIVSPNKYRLDILKTIADQFVFTVREDADLQEQVDILSNILHVYNKRGSIDTIENMWKYYGGTLPKDVKVVIPSYNLFRYSLSSFSGNHVFPNDPDITHIGNIYRPGVYEIQLINNTYPIPDLREFLMKELVAAGNYFYFTNTCHLDILKEDESSNPYEYDVIKDDFFHLQLAVMKSNQGFTWSGHNPMNRKSEDSAWSGRGSIYLELIHLYDLTPIYLNIYKPYMDEGFDVFLMKGISSVLYNMSLLLSYKYQIENYLYCTPTDSSLYIARYLYGDQGLIDYDYPGYFVLGKSLLGKEVI